MPKKPPARGTQRKVPAKPTSKSKPKPRPNVKVAARAKAARTKAARAKAAPVGIDTEERLREAMEELVEARAELSRLGHGITAAHRQIEDDRLSAASARENMRSELSAVRTDLKTALAEAEIARADRERIAAHAQKRIHELEAALASLRDEVAELRATAPLPPPPVAGGGDGDKPIS